MAEMWYYTTEGKQMDPVSIRELKRLVGDGTLKPTDMVWKEGMPRWIRASSLKELFPDPTSALDKYFTSTGQAETKPAAAAAPPPAAPAAKSGGTASEAVVPAKTTPPIAEEPQQKRKPSAKDADDEPGRPPRRRPEPQGGGSNLVIILGLLAGAFVLLAALFGGVIILIMAFKPGPDQKQPIVEAKDKRGERPARAIDGVMKFDEQLKPNENREQTFRFRQGIAYDISAQYQPKDAGASVQLFVINPNGNNRIAGPERYLKWTPPDDGEYKVQVANNGNRDLKAAVTIKEWKADPLPQGVREGKGSFSSKGALKPNAAPVPMRLRVREGYPATINLTALKAGFGTNFHLIITKDNDENQVIASDTGPNANASVSFELPATEIVKVLVKNVGRTASGVTVRYNVSP